MSTLADMYLEHNQASKMELFAKTVDSNKPLTIFTKSSTPDVCRVSKYTSDLCVYLETRYTKKKKERKYKSKVQRLK